MTRRTKPTAQLVRAGRRARRELLGAVNVVRLLVAGPPKGTPRWIYVGDSHAVHLIDAAWPSPAVAVRDRTSVALYLGPRLLFTVATHGFPAWVHRMLRVQRRSPAGWRGRPVQLVVVLGEIDVRCHLARAGRIDTIEVIAAGAVRRVVELTAELPPGSGATLCLPLPPSQTYSSAEAFPIVGEVSERIHLLDRLDEALTRAAATTGGQVRTFDPRPFVADDSGELRSELTFDGCHVNAQGAEVVRRALAAASGVV